MKNLLKIFFVVIMVIILRKSCMAYDEPVLSNINFNFNYDSCIMKDGHILVSINSISDNMSNINIDYNNIDKSIKVYQENQLKITLYIDKLEAYINNNEKDKIQLDLPPAIINNSVMIPLKTLSENTECFVEWNENLKMVYIGSSQEDVNISKMLEILSNIIQNVRNERGNVNWTSQNTDYFWKTLYSILNTSSDDRITFDSSHIKVSSEILNEWAWACFSDCPQEIPKIPSTIQKYGTIHYDKRRDVYSIVGASGAIYNNYYKSYKINDDGNIEVYIGIFDINTFVKTEGKEKKDIAIATITLVPNKYGKKFHYSVDKIFIKDI